MITGNMRTTSIPVFLHRPGSRGRCQRSDPPESTQLCPLAPFFHQEVLEDRRCGSPTAARTLPAHKPPASMSWSARRLRQEPFDERSAWKFPPSGSSPHWRPDSALFLIGKSAKKNPSRASSAERGNDLHHAELECQRVLLHQTLLNICLRRKPLSPPRESQEPPGLECRRSGHQWRCKLCPGRKPCAFQAL